MSLKNKAFMFALFLVAFSPWVAAAIGLVLLGKQGRADETYRVEISGGTQSVCPKVREFFDKQPGNLSSTVSWTGQVNVTRYVSLIDLGVTVLGQAAPREFPRNPFGPRTQIDSIFINEVLTCEEMLTVAKKELLGTAVALEFVNTHKRYIPNDGRFKERRMFIVDGLAALYVIEALQQHGPDTLVYSPDWEGLPVWDGFSVPKCEHLLAIWNLEIQGHLTEYFFLAWGDFMLEKGCEFPSF